MFNDVTIDLKVQYTEPVSLLLGAVITEGIAYAVWLEPPYYMNDNISMNWQLVRVSLIIYFHYHHSVSEQKISLQDLQAENATLDGLVVAVQGYDTFEFNFYMDYVRLLSTPTSAVPSGEYLYMFLLVFTIPHHYHSFSLSLRCLHFKILT